MPPALLLLNTSVIHRVGANRMYVPMARRWAAAGFLVFRIDLSGLGDSPMVGFRARQRMYSMDGVQDVRAAMDYLSASRGVTKFILIGLCSGAYMAFHTGLEDSRVVAQVMLNPQTFEWREGDSLDVNRKLEYKSFRFYLRAALQKDTWSRLLQGRVHWQGIMRALAERMIKNARTNLRHKVVALIENRITENRVWTKFKKLLERNTQLYLIYSQEDPGLDEFALQLGRDFRRLSSYRTFKMDLIDGPDHTFTPLWSQKRIEDMITDYVMSWGSPQS
jgi:pimeloyl-ACP methyl ester carboxylesterase